MGKGGGGSGSSTTTQNIPEELKPLYRQSGQRMTELQNEAPLSRYLSAKPLNVPGLSANQLRARDLSGGVGGRPEAETMAMERVGRLNQLGQRRVTGEGVENAPAIQAALRAYELNDEPALINRVKLMGLGNSTAVSNAMARGRADLMLPLIQGELGREERGIERELMAEQAGISPLLALGGTERQGRLAEIASLQETGGVERQVEQEAAAAELNDYLRQQALAEQALFAPFSQLPSTIGQTTRTSQSGGGGLFK